LNDIEDVERHLPGLIRATNEWFRSVFLLIGEVRSH
jgi:inorganic pyrophosphatase